MPACSIRMRFAELDAVTVDGYGTLLELDNPETRLQQALALSGVGRDVAAVGHAFETEASYYRARAHLGRDERTLAKLRQDCVGVFLSTLEAALEPAAFVEDFVAALEFNVVCGAAHMLGLLRARGLRLAVVANWDCSLPQQLARLGLDGLFDTVVTSAEAGAPKPSPEPFALALRRLHTNPDRALHVGDEPADEQGAQAAGMRFAPAPLARAFEGWE
ncbi:MAG: hypothetical protein C5B48_03550 [Candidatus Rokuibacteriota bacterium]|nr:MAG: hypothetical protein C5B48_03550 [Candidatus Rokubacteria bacterium]